MGSEICATASIVLYNSNPQELERILTSFDRNRFLVYLIDNSPYDLLRPFSNWVNVIYLHNPTNPGFGAGHNVAIKRAIETGSKYHFIVNPDVVFEGNVLFALISEMQSDSSIGMIMPKILNLDGSLQYLPKLLPTPLSILLRKIKRPKFIYAPFINRYELRSVPEEEVYNSVLLSGCFCLLNLANVIKVGLFDENYFMYIEDWDLSRRVHKKYKTIYFPKVFIYHGYQSGANKNFKLFLEFLKSSLYYFNKWGWFFDSERRLFNRDVLNQFRDRKLF